MSDGVDEVRIHAVNRRRRSRQRSARNADGGCQRACERSRQSGARRREENVGEGRRTCPEGGATRCGIASAKSLLEYAVLNAQGIIRAVRCFPVEHPVARANNGILV